jgi:hypothetical protein
MSPTTLFLPGTGRGTMRSMVEGGCFQAPYKPPAPSVSRFATATSPQAGRIL